MTSEMIKSKYYVSEDIQAAINIDVRYSRTAGQCPECGGTWYYDMRFHNWFCLDCKTVQNNFNGFQVEEIK